MNEQHATLDDVAAMVAEQSLAMRHLTASLGDMVAIQRAILSQIQTQTNLLSRMDAQQSGANATLQAMLRELQRLNGR